MELIDQARYDAIRKAMLDLLPQAQKEFDDAIMTGVGLRTHYDDEGVHFTKITADEFYALPGEPGFGVQEIRMVSREEFMRGGEE